MLGGATSAGSAGSGGGAGSGAAGLGSSGGLTSGGGGGAGGRSTGGVPVLSGGGGGNVVPPPGGGAGAGVTLATRVERRYQFSAVPPLTPPLNRKYSYAPAATGLYSANAVGAVVAPLIACTTRMPSATVDAPAPPALRMPTPVVPLALPVEITSLSDAELSSPSTVLRYSAPPLPT